MIKGRGICLGFFKGIKMRILVIDFKAVGHSIKFGMMNTKLSAKEKPTFLIYGFLLKLNFLMRKTKSNMIVYALDSKHSKRRHIYASYKENRQNKTQQQIDLDELAYPQFDALEKYVFLEIGYRNIFGVKGFEADDIIASFCKTHKNHQIIICTSDQDLYQLLTNNVCIINTKTNKYYTKTYFENEYGIKPEEWKHVKSIGGCSSDNVKGVPIPQTDITKKQLHVAEKGALNYIKGEMKPTTKAHKAITSFEGQQVVKRNLKLVTLPFNGTPEIKIRPEYLTREGLLNVAKKFEFSSIIKDINSWSHILKLR